MRREKNLFGAVADFTNLYRAFLGASAGRRDRPAVQAFEFELENQLCVIRRELMSGSYQWGAYRHFTISDPKRREIRAAPFRDRVVHHALFNVLDELFRRGFIADTYACIPGRGTHRAVHRYRQFVRARHGRGYVVQCDIAAYFGSVDHHVLMALLARRIGDARLLALLGSLIAHGAEESGKGMPIGNLTSQLFANLYLDPLDHLVKERLCERHYIRYMDDFVLLVDDLVAARMRFAQMREFLDQRLRLQLNPRRIIVAPLRSPRDFVGYVHHADGRVRIRRRSVRRLWQRLPVLADGLTRRRCDWLSVRASVASWFGIARHADAYQLSRAIFARRDVHNIGKRLLAHATSASWRRRPHAASAQRDNRPTDAG